MLANDETGEDSAIYFKLQLILENYINKHSDEEEVLSNLIELNVINLKDRITDAMITIEDSLDSELEKKFYELIVLLLEQKFISYKDLFLRAKPKTLKYLNIDKDSEKFKQKTSYYERKLRYILDTYNLFRENSFNYSSFIVSLFELIEDKTRVSEVLNFIKEQIGTLDMDLFRVIDILMHLFAIFIQTHYDYFPYLFKSFNLSPEKLTSIISTRYKIITSNTKIDLEPEYFHSISLLVKEGLIEMKDIAFELLPSEEGWEKEHANFIKELKTKPIDFTISNQESHIFHEIPKTNVQNNNTIILNNSNIFPKKNHKICFLNCLLILGCLEEAKYILLHYPQCIYLNTTTSYLIGDIIDFILNLLNSPKESCPLLSTDSIVDIKSQVNESSNTNINTNIKDKINSIENINDKYLTSELLSLIDILGPHLMSFSLFKRLSNIASVLLSNNSLDSNVYNVWLSNIVKSIIPALSFCDSKPKWNDVLWDTLSQLNIKTRFSIYAYLYESKAVKNEYVLCSEFYISKLVKGSLRRLTNDNVGYVYNLLSFYLIHNPIQVIPLLIDNVMKFENQIDAIIKLLANLPNYSSEIICYFIVQQLNNTSKHKLKEDKMTYSLWFKNLSKFTAKLCIYNDKIDISFFLQYIMTQLYNNNYEDLLTIKDLITYLSVVKSYNTATKEQLEALSGGIQLRKQTYILTFDYVVTDDITLRFINYLTKSKLLNALIMLLFQCYQKLAYSTDNNINVISNRLDSIREVITQLNELIQIYDIQTEIVECLPTINDFYEGNIELHYYFIFVRSQMGFMIYNHDSQLVNKETQNGNTFDTIWQKSLSLHINNCKRLLCTDLIDGIGAEFYVTFWQLQLYDIFIPKDAYKDQINKLKEITQNKWASSSEREGNGVKLDLLVEEFKQHVQHRDITLKRLTKEKDYWFLNHFDRKKIVQHLFQNCILKRCLFNSKEALFCSKFIEILHKIGTGNLSTFVLIKQFFDHLEAILLTLTENEAINFGIFLNGVLEITSHWHLSKKNYNKEVLGHNLPGFRKEWYRKEFINQKSDQTKPKDMYQYEEFCCVYYQWHTKLFQVIIKCFASKQILLIKNSIYFLNTIRLYFPKVSKIVSRLKEELTILLSNDIDLGIKPLIKSYLFFVSKNNQNYITSSTFKNPSL